jgi:hypothetical protein
VIEPTKLSFWCSTRRASRVTAVGVRMALAIEVCPFEWVGLKPRKPPRREGRACSAAAGDQLAAVKSV